MSSSASQCVPVRGLWGFKRTGTEGTETNHQQLKYKFSNFFFRIGFSGSPLCEAPIESAAREGRTGRQHPRISTFSILLPRPHASYSSAFPPNPSNSFLPPLRSIVDPRIHLHSESPRLPFLVVSCL